VSLFVELKWGYTTDSIGHAARRAVALAGVPGDPAAWFDLAHQEICIELYTTDERPTFWYLVDVGRDAIWAEQRHHRRHHGYADRDYTNGPESAARFCKYWARQPAASPEDNMIDRIAVLQIMPRLSHAQRNALLALSVWDDYQLAADALEVSGKGFCSLVAKGRKRFFQLWHEHETPSRSWRRDRRVWDRSENPVPRSGWFQAAEAS